MMESYYTQYSYVRESRSILFDYCQTIKASDFIKEKSSFGQGGSIRNLLVHIANTYRFWIANTALNKELAYTEFVACDDIKSVTKLFAEVDMSMDNFFEDIRNGRERIFYQRDGELKVTTPLRLFTHVITHEFHHKGQIMSLSRHLGYVPVDTDMIR